MTRPGRSSPSATPSTCPSTTAGASCGSRTSCATSARSAVAPAHRAPGPQARARAQRGLRHARRARPRPKRPHHPGRRARTPARAHPRAARPGRPLPDPKTRRFCAGLLDHESAPWTFTRVPGVPATNNAVERALRHAVLWRKMSYGTQTDHGERLVGRLFDYSRDLSPARPPPAQLPHRGDHRRPPPPPDPRRADPSVTSPTP